MTGYHCKPKRASQVQGKVLIPARESRTSDFNYREISSEEEIRMLNWQYSTQSKTDGAGGTTG